MTYLIAHLGKLWTTQAQSDQCFSTFPHVDCFSAFFFHRIFKARVDEGEGRSQTLGWERQRFNNELKVYKTQKPIRLQYVM